MPTSTYYVLCLTLALYTYAIFFGIRRDVLLRHLLALIAGVILDGYMSLTMVMRSSGPPTVHGIIGGVAWILMLFLAVRTYSSGRNRFSIPPGIQKGLGRMGVAFYAIWLLSLFTGYAAHVAAIDRTINIIGG